MRQPLVTMTRMANALTQCVMRTMSGCILTQCACVARVGSIERPLAAVSSWSAAIDYTLQGLPAVTLAKADQRRVEPAGERDRLEQLAHLRRAHQAVGLVCERQEFGSVFRGRARHDVGDAAIDQELRLACIARQLEAALARRRRDGAEIDVAGYVLQPREQQRVGVRLVAVVAHDR